MFDGEEITALQRDGDLTLVAGSSEGTLKLFDLRFPTPYIVKQHPYMVPINEIVFHQKAEKMVVSDEKSIRIYDKNTANLFTVIESKFKINGVKTYQDSGLLLVPQEARRIGIDLLFRDTLCAIDGCCPQMVLLHRKSDRGT